MAKKTVNVVFKVDDAELQKVKVAIQGTAADTKKAEDAMTRFASSAKTSGGTISSTIAGATLQMQQLRAQIELTDQRDTARLNNLKAQYQEAKARVDEFSKALQTTGTTAAAADTNFLSLKGTIASVFSAIAIKQVISFTLEMAKLAGTAEGVERAFKRTFGNSDVLLQQLQKSTHGTISNLELMQQTLKATNLGVSVEHLGVLFEFAAARAQQTGESVDYLVDSIVRGIGRKSILVLDNLGLSATRLREQFGGAAIASKSVAEVTAGVAAIAQVELNKMGGYIETGATKVAQLNVAWQTLKLTIAKVAEDSGITGFFVDLLKTITENASASAQLKENITAVAAAGVSKFIGSGKKTNDEIREEIVLRFKKRDALEAELIAFKKNNDELVPGVLTQVKAFEQEIKVQSESIRILGEYNNAIGEVAKVKAAPGAIPVLTDQIENLNEQIQNASEAELPALNTKLADLQERLKSLRALRVTEQDPFVSDAPKTGMDVLLDNAEKTLPAVEKLQDDFFNSEMKKLDDAYKAEQGLATLNANETLRRDEELSKARIKLKEQEARQRTQLEQAATNYALASLDRVLTFSLISRRDDMAAINNYYDSQISAAGNNEVLKKKIEKERAAAQERERVRQAKADQEDAITKIEIDTAVGVIRALITPPVPNFALAALVAGAGLVQAATVRSVAGKSLRTRAFAEGEVDIDGPGTTTSDSIFARISRGESVINADATHSSTRLLEAINERKIDDRILSRIAADGGHQGVAIDLSPLIKELRDSRVDFDLQGAILYKSQYLGETLKIRSRAKNQGYK